MKHPLSALLGPVAILLVACGPQSPPAADRSARPSAEAEGAGAFDAAVERLATRLEQSPDDPSLRRNYAATLMAAGRVDEALTQYESILEREPTDVDARYLQGRALIEAGRLDAARRSYEMVLEVAPDHAPARFALASLLQRQGDFEGALVGFRELLARDPDYERAHVGEAACLMRLERWTEARASIKAGLEAVPISTALAELGARLLAAAPAAEVRDGRQALGLAEKLVRLNSSFQRQEILAMALAELGRFEEAVEAQERALEGARTAGAAATRVARMESILSGYRRSEPSREPLVD